MARSVLVGRLVAGVGQGKHFTQLGWARRQFIARLGIDPFPGTVNLVIDEPESQELWQRLRDTPGVRIDNPNSGPRDCDARCYPVVISGGIEAAIVLPEVPGYSPVQVEVIAAVGVREALSVEDGDVIELEIG